jgi:hypothetical protein
MDISSFDLQPTFLTAVRFSAALFASAVLFALFASKCMKTQSNQPSEDQSEDETTKSSTSDKTNESDQNHMYVYKVDKNTFDNIVRSYDTLTCIIPSDNEIEENSSGIIISDNLDSGVIVFDVQDTYYSYDDMLDNDFATNRVYPSRSSETDYYYLVYARMFLSRTLEPGKDSKALLSTSSSSTYSLHNDVDESRSDSDELPATAFYYAKVDDNDIRRDRHGCGVEITLSAASSPALPHKEL